MHNGYVTDELEDVLADEGLLYLLDDEDDLGAQGFSILTLAQIDAPVVEDTADPTDWRDGDGRVVYLAPKAFIPAGSLVDDLPGYIGEDRLDPTRRADELNADEDELLAYLHRCDDLDVSAWQRDPEADMTDDEKAARAEARAGWRAAKLRVQKRLLHRRFQEYFGRRDYSATGTIALWIADDSQPRGVRLAAQQNVLAWLKDQIAAKDGDELRGVMSAVRGMESRLAAQERRHAQRLAA